MKTRKAALTALTAAGLAALPLSAAADSTASLPQGKATGAAATVTVSLAPLNNLAGGSIDTVLSTLNTLYSTLCGNSSVPAGTCPALQIPTSLPKQLTVAVAQSIAGGALTNDFSDVLTGQSSSTPVYTSWKELNFDIGVLETALQNLINGQTAALLSGNLPALGSAPTAALPTAGLINVQSLNIEGTVSAFLNQDGKSQFAQTANAVSVNGVKGSQLQGLDISVDPFSAVAANSKAVGDSAANLPAGVTSPQVAASNTLTHVGLPALSTSNANPATLSSLVDQLKGLTTNLLNAIAAYQQGGLSSVTTALQGTPLAGLGSALATLPTAPTVDLTPLKALATKLSAAADEASQLNAAIAGLPDTTNLVYSTDALSTAALTPMTGGGVSAMGTSDIGSLSVLPIGGALAGELKTALTTLAGAGVPVNTQVTGATPLLSVGGVSSSSLATIAKDGTGVAQGSGSLKAITVLGQSVPLDAINSALSKGTEASVVVTVPTLGSVTLDITQGVPQVVSDTTLDREVRMATLDIRLINGNVCSGTCTQLPPSVSTGTGAHTAATTAGSGGIAALGNDSAPLLDLGLGDTTAAVTVAPVTPPTGCQTDCSFTLPDHQTPNTPTTTAVGSETSLPKTGMFGGGALPAGLLLIAVAISLRLVPSLRLRLPRVR